MMGWEEQSWPMRDSIRLNLLLCLGFLPIDTNSTATKTPGMGNLKTLFIAKSKTLKHHSTVIAKSKLESVGFLKVPLQGNVSALWRGVIRKKMEHLAGDQFAYEPKPSGPIWKAFIKS